jgi:hypothetical protein
MWGWFGFSDLPKEEIIVPKEKTNSKALASVKSTSINVVVDDNSMPGLDARLTATNTLLSDELLRQSPSIPIQYKSPRQDGMVTPHSSVPRSMRASIHRSPSIHSQSSSSALHRMAHSPKSSAATMRQTHVSVSGSTSYEAHYLDNEEEGVTRSPSNAVETLSRKIKQQTQIDDPLPLDEQDHVNEQGGATHKHHRSLSNDTKSLLNDNKKSLKGQRSQLGLSVETHSLTDTSKDDLSQQPTKIQAESPASWTSYLFSKPKQKSKQPIDLSSQKTEVPLDSSFLETNGSPSTSVQMLMDQDQTLRKVKSASALPTSTVTKVVSPYHQPSNVSNSSISLRLATNAGTTKQQPKKKKNFVLPLFESQFQKIPDPTIPTKPNLFIQAMDAINAILVQPSDTQQQQEDANWFARRMKDKFTNFLEDIKSEDRLSDKRIAIVAIHGWYPVKVSFLF